MSQARWLALFSLAAPLGCTELSLTPTPADADRSTSLVSVVEQFSLPSLEGWSFRTPALWHISRQDEQSFLQLATFSPSSEQAGRPNEYALYTKLLFESFSLSCRVRLEASSARPGRDACVVFARVDASHFYCVQIADEASGMTPGIYCMDGTRLRPLLAAGTPIPQIEPDNDWHKLDILHDAQTGLIQVFWDAFDPERLEPWMQVTDRTYQRGYIALGSVAHPARFARLILQGQAEVSAYKPIRR